MPDALTLLADAVARLSDRLADLETRRQVSNQELDTASSPTFNGLAIANSGGTGSLYTSYSGTLATGATLDFPGNGGILMIRETSGNSQEIVQLTYGGLITVILGSFMTINSDAGATFALFLNAGLWRLHNRYGASRGYAAWIITV